MAVTYINFVKVDGLPYINRAARLPKACQSGLTKKQIDRSNRLACGYSIIRFLSLSMLSQVELNVLKFVMWILPKLTARAFFLTN